MNFPKKARYNIVMNIVQNFFIKENIIDFPLDPFQIIKNNNWGLYTYSELAIEHGVTIPEIISAVQSEDGYTIYDGVNYTIAYNDTIFNEGRIRFTLLHEIGHIYLKHLIDFKETILSRSRLTESKYKILEYEANAFARNALAPTILVMKMELWSESNDSDIIRYFGLSQSAARVRINSLLLDYKHYIESMIRFQLNHFKSFIFNTINSKYCLKCNHFFIHANAKKCPICSSAKIINKKGFFIVKYDGYEVDSIGRAIICPECDNEEVFYEGDHCKICKTFLVNKCADSLQLDEDGYSITQKSCHTTLDGNARYCVSCGNESTFYQQGLLEDWKKVKEQKEEFSGFPF